MYALPVSIIFICMATIVVALRLFTRVRLLSGLGWDDWFLLFALLTDYAFFGVLVAEHSYGLGRRGASLAPDESRNQLKMLWISVPLYNLSLNLTKVSVVLLYMYIFSTRTYRILLRVLLVLVTCTGLYMFFGTLFICSPIHAFWEPKAVDHSCFSREAVWYINAALQIVGNLTLVVLPMPPLLTLRIPLRQKICLMGIFALGLFVCATSIVRLYVLVRLLNSDDFFRYNGAVATWSFIEVNTAIICASLPAFRQVIIQSFPRILPSRAHKTYGQRGEKRLQDPQMFWGPFSGVASYSADVSVRADQESASPYGEGIHVLRELRWEMGSVASGGENAVPENGGERADSNHTYNYPV